MNTINNVNDQLLNFKGTEKVFFHPFGFVYTEGVQHLAEHFLCYWLIDDIFIHSKSRSALYQEQLQVWKLKRINKSNAFTITAQDGNYNQLFQTKIPFSDFKGDEVTIWFITGTMLLPSEY